MPRVFTAAQFAAHQKMYSRAGARPAEPTQEPLAGTTALSFVIPLPPTVNDLYRSPSDKEIANGMDRRTKFLTAEQQAFRNDVIGVLHICMRGREPLAGRLDVWLRLHFANKRRTDIDGRIKATLDSLQHARAYNDDSQIDKLTVERVVDPDAPEFCSVEIREVA